MSTKTKEPRIMYIEYKGDGKISGPARIGRVTFSNSGQSLYYRGRLLHKGSGFKSNFFDSETREEYWISGCKKNGGDRLYSGVIEIDDDVRDEYWTDIRKKPEKKNVKRIRAVGKYNT
jgi:hypothetical protein